MGRFIHEVEKLPIAELLEYLAYDRIEPFGDTRGDLQAGIVAATVANSVRTRGKAAQPSDYMPDFTPKAAQTPEQMAIILQQFTQLHNAKLRK
jgi:hypothetical protein